MSCLVNYTKYQIIKTFLRSPTSAELPLNLENEDENEVVQQQATLHETEL